MTLVLAFIVITVVLIVLLNGKRWSGLARGARDAKRGLKEEVRSEDKPG
jgi:Sec-independent protein translocase protein TatA